jgi:hypothetical protein
MSSQDAINLSQREVALRRYARLAELRQGITRHMHQLDMAARHARPFSLRPVWLSSSVTFACFFAVWLMLGADWEPVSLMMLFAGGGSAILAGLIAYVGESARANYYRSELRWWQDCYNNVAKRLAGSGLGLLIAGDEFWDFAFKQQPGLVRPLLQAPRGRTDRIIYATAYYDYLCDYLNGHRHMPLSAFVEKRSIVENLGFTISGADPSGQAELLGKFAAVYDFFFAEQPV